MMSLRFIGVSCWVDPTVASAVYGGEEPRKSHWPSRRRGWLLNRADLSVGDFLYQSTLTRTTADISINEIIFLISRNKVMQALKIRLLHHSERLAMTFKKHPAVGHRH